MRLSKTAAALLACIVVPALAPDPAAAQVIDNTDPCAGAWSPPAVRGASPGINLSWHDCGVYGTLLKGFACDTNAGSATLYASAVSGIDMPQLNGQESVLELQQNAATLSDWWQLGTGGCRSGGIVASFNFLENTSCLDPWLGQAQGGGNFTAGYYGAGTARIRSVCAISGTTSINGTAEYYFFKVHITNLKTVGTGSCAGCSDKACFIFNSMRLTQPIGVGDYVITAPYWRNYAIWTGGTTPVARTTWGAVKSLYRR